VDKWEHIVKACKRMTYPLLAKVGHKLDGNKEEQAQTLWEHFHNKEIETYEMKRLSTFRDVIDDNSPIGDIIMLSETRKFSLDYDYKRKPLSNGTTKPFKTIHDVVRYRAVVSTLRDKKKQRATLKDVEYYQSRSKQHVRMRGGTLKDCKRHFLRALTQQVHPFQSFGSYTQVLRSLRYFDIGMDMLKNAKRNPFVANVVMNNSENRKYIRDMLKALGYTSDDNYQAWLDLLIHKGLSNPVTMLSQ